MIEYVRYIMVVIVALAITGCLEEDHFGYSSDALITEFRVFSQIGDATIDVENKTIVVEMLGSILASRATIKKMALSSFAMSDEGVGSVLNLDSIATIQVIAEDGTEAIWSIESTIRTSHPQIRNSNFNDWYQTSSGYFEPALSETIQLLSPIWSTNNGASSSIGITTVIPFEILSNNYAARMQTMDNGSASLIYGRISAGKMFTGRFSKLKHKPSIPGSGLEKGIEFVGRPTSFKIKYQYQPGDENKDRDGNMLGYSDAAEMYIFLEVRDSSSVKRLATAWFRSQATVESLTSEEIDFKYGQLNSTYPDYLSPADGQFVSSDSADFVVPTHMTFLATSSFMADSLAGAIGSVLIIDDLILKYR